MSEFTLPLRAPDAGHTVVFRVDWGDGDTEVISYDLAGYNSDDGSLLKHEYTGSTPTGGWTIKIYPVTGQKFGKYWGYLNGNAKGYADRTKLKEIKKWGCFEFGSIGHSFSGCSNLNISATDTISGTPSFYPSSLASAFKNCTSLNPAGISAAAEAAFNGFNTTGTASMESTFSGCTSFNTKIKDWDTSTIVNFNSAFQGATSFNQELNNWTLRSDGVGSPLSFQGTFYGASAFNKPLSNWNTSKVSMFNATFFGATSFNQDISNWNVSSAISMEGMFELATSFNNGAASGVESGGLTWQTNELTNAHKMFMDATSFNGDISGLNMSQVGNLSQMFQGANSFNNGGEPLSIDTGQATNMSHMFYSALNFNQSVAVWDTRQVLTMDNMFNNATSFNQPLENPDAAGAYFGDNYKPWDTSAVTNMEGLFEEATAFNQNLSSWEISNVDTATNMFQNSGQDATNSAATNAEWQSQDPSGAAAQESEDSVPSPPTWASYMPSSLAQAETNTVFMQGVNQYVNWGTSQTGTISIVASSDEQYHDAPHFEYSAENSGSVVLAAGKSVDFENPTDYDQDSTYKFVIRVTDSNGLIANHAMNLQIANDTSDDATDPIIDIIKGVGYVYKYNQGNDYAGGEYFASASAQFSNTGSTLVHVKENACYIVNGKVVQGTGNSSEDFHLINHPGSLWTEADHGTETNEISLRSGWKANSGRISHAEYESLPVSGPGLLKTMFEGQKRNHRNIFIVVESGGILLVRGSSFGAAYSWVENPFTGIKEPYSGNNGQRVKIVMKDGAKLYSLDPIPSIPLFDIIYENDFEIHKTPNKPSNKSFATYLSEIQAGTRGSGLQSKLEWLTGGEVEGSYNPYGDYKYIEGGVDLSLWHPGGVDKIVPIEPIFDNPIEQVTYSESQLNNGVTLEVPTVMPLKVGMDRCHVHSAGSLENSLEYPQSGGDYFPLGTPNYKGGGNDEIQLKLQGSANLDSGETRDMMGICLEYTAEYDHDVLPRSQWSNYYSTFSGYTLAVGQDGELYAWGSARKNDGSSRFAINPGVSGGAGSKGATFEIKEGNQTNWDSDGAGAGGSVAQPAGTYSWDDSAGSDGAFVAADGRRIERESNLSQSGSGHYDWLYVTSANVGGYVAETKFSGGGPWDAEWNYTDFDIQPNIGITGELISSDTSLLHATKLFESNFPSDQFGKVQGVATGYDHNLFIRTQKSGSNFINKLYSWGANTYRQRGNNVVDDDTINEVPNGSYATSVAAGSSFTVFIRETGGNNAFPNSLWSMGSNSYGQLCNGVTASTTGDPVYTGITGVLKVRCGIYHTMFLKEDGSLWGAGDNSWGQLGQGAVATVVTPVKIADNVTDFDCGHYHSVYVQGNDISRVFSFGKNENGQLGVGTTAVTKTPQRVENYHYNPAPTTGATSNFWGRHIVAVSCGEAHTLAFDDEGKSYISGGVNSSPNTTAYEELGHRIDRDNFNFTMTPIGSSYYGTVGSDCIFYIGGYDGGQRPQRGFTTKIYAAGRGDNLGLGAANAGARRSSLLTTTSAGINYFVGANDSLSYSGAGAPFASVWPTDQFALKEVTIEENDPLNLFDRSHITLVSAVERGIGDDINIQCAANADFKRVEPSTLDGLQGPDELKIFWSLVRRGEVIDNDSNNHFNLVPDEQLRTITLTPQITPEKDDRVFLYCPDINRSVSIKYKPTLSSMTMVYKLGRPDSGNLQDVIPPVHSAKDYYISSAYQSGGRSFDRDDGPVGWLHGKVPYQSMGNKWFAGNDVRLGDEAAVSGNIYDEVKDGTYRITHEDYESLPSYTFQGENLDGNNEYQLLRIGKNAFSSLSGTHAGKGSVTNNWFHFPMSWDDLDAADNENSRITLQVLTNSGVNIEWGDGTSTLVPPTNHLVRNSNYERALAMHKYDFNDPNFPDYTITITGDDAFLSTGYQRTPNPAAHLFSRLFPSGAGDFATEAAEVSWPELYKDDGGNNFKSLYCLSNANIRAVPSFAHDGEDIEGSLAHYFAGYPNMHTAPAKMTGKVTSMQYVFQRCTHFNSSLAEWNWSDLNAYNCLANFLYQSFFNNDLPDPTTATHTASTENTRFYQMFNSAYGFNQPLNWTVPDVPYGYMLQESFRNAHSFNQPINWNIKVQNVYNCFNNAWDFNQPLNNWEMAPGSGLRTKLYGAFSKAASFNQNLNDWDLSVITRTSVNQYIELKNVFEDTRNFQNGGAPLDWGTKLTAFFAGDDGTAYANNMQVQAGNMFYRSAYNHDFKPWHDAGFFDTNSSSQFIYFLPSGYSHSFRGFTDYAWGSSPNGFFHPNYDTTMKAADYDDTLIWLDEWFATNPYVIGGSISPVYLVMTGCKYTSAASTARANLQDSDYIQSVSDAGLQS